MPARVIKSGGNNNPEKIKGPNAAKTPAAAEKTELDVQKEMQKVLSESQNVSNVNRAQFYTGNDRLSLQGPSVQRVRELQEENDHLQREIDEKESLIASAQDPLAILADIEHRKVIIARNTGEILKIYLKNEERLKRIQDLEETNIRIQKQMMEMQGQFISANGLDDKTNFASEFFILKSQIEQNLSEIKELSQK